MALAAAQVVDAIAARLAPMAATGGRVYTSRTWPLAESGLPAWRVTAEDEQVDNAMLGGTNVHTLEIAAEAAARATQDLDDTLHALAAAALPLIFADPVPYELQLTGIGRRMASEGEAAVGAITLRLRASYYVEPAVPETIL